MLTKTLKGFIPLLSFVFIANLAWATSYDYQSSTRLRPNDYLFGSKTQKIDDAFNYPVVGFEADLGLSIDNCGSMNLNSTLKSTMRNLMNSDVLKKLGTDITAAAPMLALCYMSPTMCSLAKNLRITAKGLAELRLGQCRAITQYINEKDEEFMEQRSKCARDEIKRTGGDIDAAMAKCKNWHEAKLEDWSGNGKSPENRLIESTAKWAGLKGKEADRMIKLTKAFIGDSILKKGSFSVDYGPRRLQITPRTHLMSVKDQTFKSLCKVLMGKVEDNGGHRANVYKIISDRELNDLSGEMRYNLIDRQTITSLAYLPRKKRNIYCRKLADALAMEVFSNDVSQTMDFMAAKVESNPHLPEKQKREAERKRSAFKDQVDVTMSVETRSTEPLNKVLAAINKEGARYKTMAIAEDARVDKATKKANQVDYNLFDCADGITCHFDNK